MREPHHLQRHSRCHYPQTVAPVHYLAQMRTRSSSERTVAVKRVSRRYCEQVVHTGEEATCVWL